MGQPTLLVRPARTNRASDCYFLAVSRGRYVLRLSGEFVVYARVNRTWWVLPLLILLAVALLLITAGHAAAPYVLYPVF